MCIRDRRVCHLITKQHKTPNRAIYMLRRLGVDLEDQTSEQDAEFMMEVSLPQILKLRAVPICTVLN